jgi:hypothetical protein
MYPIRQAKVAQIKNKTGNLRAALRPEDHMKMDSIAS